jgi:MFS family permease
MTATHSPAPDKQQAAPQPLWRNRDFILLWSGQAISLAGSQITLVAFPLLVLAITRSPIQAGIVGALQSVPFAILCLPAGAMADRWNRKRMMIICDAGRAVALGSIPLTLLFGHLTIAQLYFVGLVEGVLSAFFTAADSASLPQIVSKEQITAALSQSNAAESTATLIGQAASGLLYTLGRGIPFLADAVSYGASVLSLSRIRAQFQEDRDPEGPVPPDHLARPDLPVGPRRLWHEIGEGIAWLWRHPLLRFITFLTSVLYTCCGGYAIILIVLAQMHHVSNFGVGLLFATGGLGGIAGSLITPLLRDRFRLGVLLIGSAWIWAITWFVYAIAPNVFWLGAMNVLSFIVVPVYGTLQYGYRMTIIPDRLQGRVHSVFRLIAFGSKPIGLALTGVLVQALGPEWAVVALALPQIAMCVVATVWRPLRQVEPIEAARG